jgi:hypothetical protein
MEINIKTAKAIASLYSVAAGKKDMVKDLQLIEVQVIGGDLIAYATDRFTAARFTYSGDFQETATYYLNEAAVKFINSQPKTSRATVQLTRLTSSTRLEIDGNILVIADASKYPPLANIFDLSTYRPATTSPAYSVDLLARVTKLTDGINKLTRWKFELHERDGFTKGTTRPGPTLLTPTHYSGDGALTVLQMPLAN